MTTTATKQRRVLVVATATEAEMGPGFTGFGKTWRLPEGDACVYGMHPSAEGSRVKYAYFA